MVYTFVYIMLIYVYGDLGDFLFLSTLDGFLKVGSWRLGWNADVSGNAAYPPKWQFNIEPYDKPLDSDTILEVRNWFFDTGNTGGIWWLFTSTCHVGYALVTSFREKHKYHYNTYKHNIIYPKER